MKLQGWRSVFFLAWIVTAVPFVFAGGPNIGVNSNFGYMWAHRKTMLPMEAATHTLELNFSWFTQDQDLNWARLYRSPRIGFNLTYLDLGSNISGKAFGILPYIEFKILNKPRQELNFRLGSGIGYLTKTWSMVNLENKAIGSHINANMRVHFIYHLMLSKQIEISALAGITHFSNANFKMPNLGVNSVEIGFGLGYLSKGKPAEKYSYKDEKGARERRQEFKFSAATKETGLVYRKRVFVGIIGYRNYFLCTPKSRVSGGADIFYDPGYFYRDNADDVKGKPKLKDAAEVGLTLGHDLIVGRWHFVTEGGIYLYAAKWNKGPVYQRVGFKYEINKNLLASFSLKTHFARADYFEWGIAYTILQH
ncbi:MAG: hypothetical protein GC180_06340 [Bacteroidetes bacterium]|nr:hypothetical protein [Bacteroidota bacterium]